MLFSIFLINIIAVIPSFISINSNLPILLILSLLWIVIITYCLSKLLIYLTYNASSFVKVLNYFNKLFIFIFPAIVFSFPLSCS